MGSGCYVCGEHRFWRGQSGKVICASCHPPAHPSFVVEYLDEMPGPEKRKPVEVEVVNAVYDAIERGKGRGVERESLNWMVGSEEMAGAAILRVQQRDRKLSVRFRKGQETWYFRR